jgi:hypothetical protein
MRLHPAVAALVLATACATDRPAPRSARPVARPASVPSVASDAAGPWDVARRVAEADALFRQLEERSGFPSPEDRTRFAAAMRRARDARRRLADAPAPAEALVAEYEGCVADAWQMHQLYRVGEDARTPR